MVVATSGPSLRCRLRPRSSRWVVFQAFGPEKEKELSPAVGPSRQSATPRQQHGGAHCCIRVPTRPRPRFCLSPARLQSSGSRAMVENACSSTTSQPYIARARMKCHVCDHSESCVEDPLPERGRAWFSKAAQLNPVGGWAQGFDWRQKGQLRCLSWVMRQEFRNLSQRYV